MKRTKEYNNIMHNLSWCVTNSEASFTTMLANALNTRNPLLIRWIKDVTGKRQIYVGGDWLQLSEQCKEAIIRHSNSEHNQNSW